MELSNLTRGLKRTLSKLYFAGLFHLLLLSKLLQQLLLPLLFSGLDQLPIRKDDRRLKNDTVSGRKPYDTVNATTASALEEVVLSNQILSTRSFAPRCQRCKASHRVELYNLFGTLRLRNFHKFHPPHEVMFISG